jgi:hypothetical protein
MLALQKRPLHDLIREVSSDISFYFLKAGQSGYAGRSKNGAASDSSVPVPLRGTEKKSQLALFPIREEERKVEDVKESIPSAWKGISEKEWNDWRWQLRHRVTKLEQLQEILQLIPEEIEGIKQSKGRLALAVTPYFVSIMDSSNPNCPIRRQAIPRIEECHLSKNDMVDPCERTRILLFQASSIVILTGFSCSLPISVPPIADTAPEDDWWEVMSGPLPRAILRKC